MSLGALVRKLAGYGHGIEEIADIVDTLTSPIQGHDRLRRPLDEAKAEERKRKDRDRQKAKREAKASTLSATDSVDSVSERPSDVRADSVDAPSREPALAPTRVVVSSLPSEEVINPSQKPTVSSSPSTKSRKPKPPKSSRCPETWEPNDSHRGLVAELGLPPDRARMALAKFRDHEFKTPHSDWNAAFRNWLRNDAQRTGNGSGQTTGATRWSLDRERRVSNFQQGVMDFVDGGG